MPLAAAGFFLQKARQTLSGGGFHPAADFGVAELVLGLPLKLGISQLDADHGHQAAAGVIAAEGVLGVFEVILLAGVVVEHAGQRRAETGQVGAALRRQDAVGESALVGGQVVVAVGVVILERHFHIGVLGDALV